MFPLLSVDVIVIIELPIFVGIPLIVLVFESNIRPSGNPVTVFVTVAPLLSVVLIVIGEIGLYTSDD